jgi:hypothetical protein
MQFYFRVGYFNQQGIIDKSSYEKLTIKLNNTYQLTRRLKLGNNLTIAPHKEQIAPNVTYAAYRPSLFLNPIIQTEVLVWFTMWAIRWLISNIPTIISRK